MARLTLFQFEQEYHDELADMYLAFQTSGRSVFGEDFLRFGGYYYTFVKWIYDTSIL